MYTLLRKRILLFAALVTVTVCIAAASSSARLQRAAINRESAGPVLPATAYSDLVNGLSSGGR